MPHDATPGDGTQGKSPHPVPQARSPPGQCQQRVPASLTCRRGQRGAAHTASKVPWRKHAAVPRQAHPKATAFGHKPGGAGQHAAHPRGETPPWGSTSCILRQGCTAPVAQAPFPGQHKAAHGAAPALPSCGTSLPRWGLQQPALGPGEPCSGPPSHGPSLPQAGPRPGGLLGSGTGCGLPRAATGASPSLHCTAPRRWGQEAAGNGAGVLGAAPQSP